jgi:hypothetical protein
MPDLRLPGLDGIVPEDIEPEAIGIGAAEYAPEYELEAMPVCSIGCGIGTT